MRSMTARSTRRAATTWLSRPCPPASSPPGWPPPHPALALGSCLVSPELPSVPTLSLSGLTSHRTPATSRMMTASRSPVELVSIITLTSIMMLKLSSPGPSPSPSPCPNRPPSQIKVPQKEKKEGFGPWADTKITWATHHPTHHP